MKIIEEFMAKKEEPELLYPHLKSGEEFLLFNDETLRIRTDEGHVAFECGLNREYVCIAYKGADFEHHEVERVDAEVRWCRR